MSIKSIEKIDNEICYEYFSYFYYKLYDCPFFTQEELDLRKSELNDKSSEESFSNDLEQNINDLNIENKYIPLNLLDLSPKRESNINGTNEEKSINKDIKPELHKFILPKSLFKSDKNKNNVLCEENESKINNDYIKSHDNISIDDNSLLKHLDLLSQPFIPKNKIFSELLTINDDYLLIDKSDEAKNKKISRKKKKNNFVKREGDWICYRCKNLNFAFRRFCNKCKFPKEESENHAFDIGKELMKLADLSICNKLK